MTDVADPLGDSVVVCCTKDRPDAVADTIGQFAEGDRSAVLFDDSTQAATRRENRTRCRQVGVRYHGPTEQAAVLAAIDFDAGPAFIPRLGHEGFTIGATRNYAILLALLGGADRIAFVDDDVRFRDRCGLDRLIEALDYDPIASARLAGGSTGTPDDSVVGHLFRRTGVYDVAFPSGSFTALRPAAVDQYFPNYYNDDWLLFALCCDHKRPPAVGTVEQRQYDIFDDAVERALSQEVGELLFNGFVRAVDPADGRAVLSEDHWAETIAARRDRLSQLDRLALPDAAEVRDAVLDRLGRFLDAQEPGRYVAAVAAYRRRLDPWRRARDRAKEGHLPATAFAAGPDDNRTNGA